MRVSIPKISEIKTLFLVAFALTFIAFLLTNLFIYWNNQKTQKEQFQIYQDSVNSNYAKLHELMKVVSMRIENALGRKNPDYIQSILNEDFKLKIDPKSQVSLQSFYLIYGIAQEKMTGPYGNVLRPSLSENFLDNTIKNYDSLHLTYMPDEDSLVFCKGFLVKRYPYFLCLPLNEEKILKLLGLPELLNVSIKNKSSVTDEGTCLSIPNTSFKITFDQNPIEYLSREGFLVSGVVLLISFIFFVYFMFVHRLLEKRIFLSFRGQIQALRKRVRNESSSNSVLSKELGSLESEFQIWKDSHQEKEKFLEDLILSNKKMAQETEVLTHEFLKELLLENESLLRSNEINQITKSISSGLAILSYRMMPRTQEESINLYALVHSAQILFSKELIERNINLDIDIPQHESTILAGYKLFWKFVIYVLFKNCLDRVSKKGNIRISLRKQDNNFSVVFWDDGYAFDFQKTNVKKNGVFNMDFDSVQTLLRSSFCDLTKSFSSKDGNQIILDVNHNKVTPKEKFNNSGNVVPFARYEKQ